VSCGYELPDAHQEHELQSFAILSAQLPPHFRQLLLLPQELHNCAILSAQLPPHFTQVLLSQELHSCAILSAQLDPHLTQFAIAPPCPVIDRKVSRLN